MASESNLVFLPRARDPGGGQLDAPRLAMIGSDRGGYTFGSVGQESNSAAGAAPTAAHAPTVPSTSEPTAKGSIGPGTILADRYRLVRRIGGGGMGSVWESEHLALATTVAIKLINPALVDDERARSRFLREARAAAALRSPHVVQTYDYGVHDGTPYIAMELLAGEPLSDRLTSKGRLSADEVLELVVQIGRAVAKAHEAGVVHRDLKPDNIYLVPGEHGDVAKVLDFGIAKHAAEVTLDGATTKSGSMLGTPYYMSPEQLIDPGLADGRSDLWSLAVITYECLLGKRPFIAESMPELAVAVLAEPIPVPSDHGAVPPGFDAWFARALQREPDDRFPDVGKMVDALTDALRHEGSTVVLSTPADLRSPTARRRMPIALLVAVVSAAAIVGLVITSQRASTPDQTTTAPAPTRSASDAEPVRVHAPVPARTEVPQPPAPKPVVEVVEAKSPSDVPAIEPRRRPPPGKAPRERTPTKTPPGEAKKHDVNELEP